MFAFQKEFVRFIITLKSSVTETNFLFHASIGIYFKTPIYLLNCQNCTGKLNSVIRIIFSADCMPLPKSVCTAMRTCHQQ